MQFRVIAALVRREMQAHFGESRLGYLWALIEPVLHLAGFLVVFVLILHRPAPMGTSTALFMLTGIIPYFLYSKMMDYVSGAVIANRALLNLPPVKPLDVVLARVVLESTTFMFVGFLMLLALYMGGVEGALPHNLLRVLEASAAATCLGLGVGMINLVIRSLFTHWMTIFSVVSFPLWLFSGIWFLPEQVPVPFRDYMLWNPITHLLMWFRTGFYPDAKAVFLDESYALAFIGVVLAAGLALMRVARRQILAPP